MSLSPSPTLDSSLLDRAYGTVLGSAVGDALGAPFEFGPPHAYDTASTAGVFAARGTEMIGGGPFNWEPGEWTDDTQLAITLGEQLIADGTLSPRGLFAAMRTWARSGPHDIGATTAAALTSRHGWAKAASTLFAAGNPGAGNGGVMRIAPLSVYLGLDEHGMPAARMARQCEVSALTHGDPAAGWGAAIVGEVIAAGLHGASVDEALEAVPVATARSAPSKARAKWQRTVDPHWTPAAAEEGNGAVWACVGTALWAVRASGGFAGAVRAAINCGGDTDTVAAVTGAIAGALYGEDEIPQGWLAPLHGQVPGIGSRAWDASDLRRLTRELIALGSR